MTEDEAMLRVCMLCAFSPCVYRVGEEKEEQKQQQTRQLSPRVLTPNYE